MAKFVADVEAGAIVDVAIQAAESSETYQSFTTDRNEKRKAAGIVMARDEQNNRVRYVYKVLGALHLEAITDDHIRQVLEDARDHGLAMETLPPRSATSRSRCWP